MKKRVWNLLTVAAAAAALIYIARHITAGAVEIDGGCREVMGTFARIVVVAANEDAAWACAEAGFEELNRIDSVMSDYKADSELSRVNREASAGAVKVSDELFGILEKSVEYSRMTEGAFDITVGPLVDLWHRAGEANEMPGEVEIAEAKEKVGYEKLVLDANEGTVRFGVEGMRLDLGGIAKGYAVDMAVEVMKQHGAIGGMVDNGGNISCFGKPSGRDYWLIGVQDPNAVDGRPMIVLKLRDMGVATSGDYRRFVMVDRKKVSHIIDTNTGMGAKKLSSDTIIARTAIEADALSTAVNVLGPKKGLVLIESLPDVECIMITPGPEYHIIGSHGADAYSK